MKKKILGVLALLSLSSLAFGSNYSTQSDNVTVNIKIVKPITLNLTENGIIDFGSVPQETNTELAALNTISMNVTGADPDTEIAFYINDEDQDDVSTGEEIILAETGGAELTATLKLDKATEITDGTGAASAIISASIAASAISGTTTLGDYTQSIAVYANTIKIIIKFVLVPLGTSADLITNNEVIF